MTARARAQSDTAPTIMEPEHNHKEGPGAHETPECAEEKAKKLLSAFHKGVQ
jgi:hypothetical protein